MSLLRFHYLLLPVGFATLAVGSLHAQVADPKPPDAAPAAANSVSASATVANIPLDQQHDKLDAITEATTQLVTLQQQALKREEELNALKLKSTQDKADIKAANEAKKQADTLTAIATRIVAEKTKKLQDQESRQNQIKMLYISHSILLSLHSAANGLFASGTFGNAEGLFHRTSSVWASDDLRNGWDRLAGYTRFVGPALTMGGYYLTKTNASPELTNALIATGSLGFVLGEGGKALGGTSEKDLVRALTNVVPADEKGPDGKVATSKYQRVMEHIALSRSAYDQINLRLKVYDANRKKAEKILQDLLPAIEDANQMSDALLAHDSTIDYKKNSKLAADVLTLTSRYADALTANAYAVRDLRATYDYLAQYFPSSKDRFAAQLVLLDNFLTRYDELVEKPVVSRLAEAQRQLSRWRENNEKAVQKEAMVGKLAAK